MASGSSSSSEEENLTNRLRKAKKRCNDDDDGYNKKKKEDEAQDNEQPGPSDQTHNKGTPENAFWDVTCGNKRGILNIEKLAKGEDCILYKGRWYQPYKFEDKAGKGASKKWKSTISHKDKLLQYYIDQGIITTVRVKKKTKTPEPKPISHISTEESTEETEEDNPADDDWLPNTQDLVQEVEDSEEQRLEAEDEEAVELDKNAGGDSEMGEREEGEPKRNNPPHEKNKKIPRLVIKRLPEVTEAMSDHQPSCREHPLAAENPGQADATTSGRDAARLPEHETPVNHTTPATDTVEDPCFRPCANIDLDTMNLDQLNREKIKVQLKLLKLEQEYYTLKIRKLKKDNANT